MNDERSSADHERCEEAVVRRLRVVTVMVILMDIATAIVACYPSGIVITDTMYIEHTTAAGGGRLAAYLVILALPGIAVFRRPRWTPIVFWIVWALSCMCLALSYLFRLYGDNEMIWPRWPAWVMGLGCFATMLGLGFVIPAIRGSHRSPRSHSATTLPAARVHRP